MKILIISDSHGFTSRLEKILLLEHSADVILHLGDGGKNLDEFNDLVSSKPVYIVKGNCDYSVYDYPDRIISSVGNIRFYACHGHLLSVKESLLSLVYAARENKCKIAFFGHTHVPYYDMHEDISLFNPGSVLDGNYGIMQTYGDKFTLELKTLPKD